MDVEMVCGWYEWETVRCENMNVMSIGVKRMGNGAVKPAVWMVGRKNASLCVVPPFLHERERKSSRRNYVFKTMRANGKRKVLSGSIGGRVAGEWG